MPLYHIQTDAGVRLSYCLIVKNLANGLANGSPLTFSLTDGCFCDLIQGKSAGAINRTVRLAPTRETRTRIFHHD